MSEYTAGQDVPELIRSLDQRVAALEAGSKGLWRIPVLEHAWTGLGGEFAPASYLVDDFGFVHFRGVVKPGENEKTIFQLPVGVRPSRTEIFAVICNGALARVDVRANGEVLPALVTSNYLSLSGITFLAEH